MLQSGVINQSEAFREYQEEDTGSSTLATFNSIWEEANIGLRIMSKNGLLFTGKEGLCQSPAILVNPVLMSVLGKGSVATSYCIPSWNHTNMQELRFAQLVNYANEGDLELAEKPTRVCFADEGLAKYMKSTINAMVVRENIRVRGQF